MMQPRRYPRIIKHRMANLGIYPYAQDGPRIMHFVRRAQSYHQTLVRQSITLTQTLKRCVDLETKLDEAQERLQQLRANQPAAMVDDKGVVWRTSLKLPEIPPGEFIGLFLSSSTPTPTRRSNDEKART